jgi:ABC-2 type transport system ATP-binding protein
LVPGGTQRRTRTRTADPKGSAVIHVSKLTKYYGDYAAVRDVSFDVARGQIVGFLGPNGAGKTTTMRVLAGYLTATSGRATIDGLDVFWKPVEVRRRIGYMPESCPLYPEMRVAEYLRFRAGVKGLHGRHAARRVAHVLKRCWVDDVSRQLVGTLSKGYRQRVGLADALLGEPPVLILDEPTAGLDPAQIRETRVLIRELGEKHTILLSTHILSEVEMTCDHVIIINRGSVAEAGPLAELARKAGKDAVLVAELGGEIDADAVRKLFKSERVEVQALTDGVRLRVPTADPAKLAAKLAAHAVEKGWQVRELRPQQQTLEDLFVRVVGQRDENAVAVA